MFYIHRSHGWTSQIRKFPKFKIEINIYSQLSLLMKTLDFKKLRLHYFLITWNQSALVTRKMNTFPSVCTLRPETLRILILQRVLGLVTCPAQVEGGHPESRWHDAKRRPGSGTVPVLVCVADPPRGTSTRHCGSQRLLCRHREGSLAAIPEMV